MRGLSLVAIVLISGCQAVSSTDPVVQARVNIAAAAATMTGNSAAAPQTIFQDESNLDASQQSVQEPEQDDAPTAEAAKAHYRCEKCGQTGWREHAPGNAPSPIANCPDPLCRGLMKLYETP